jgi:type II secretory ATPase GspE/PulE/Tfp pilus assembly ATPase PilB-like protein
MIGEIRDEESSHIAVRAANSGILVVATLQAESAVRGGRRVPKRYSG